MILGRRGRLFGDTRKSAFVREQEGGFTFLLDEYPGFSQAISSYLLSSTYTGALFELVRLSDNATEQFKSDNDNKFSLSSPNLSETTTLGDWIGSGDADYITAYDQTGNGNHYFMNTVSKRPPAVRSGVLESINGNPCIGRESADEAMQSTYAVNGNNRKVFFVGDINQNSCLLGEPALGSSVYIAQPLINAPSTETVRNERINSVPQSNFSTRTDVYNQFINNQTIFSFECDFTLITNELCLGFRPSGTIAGLGNYRTQALLVHESTVDVAGVENVLNQLYNIF